MRLLALQLTAFRNHEQTAIDLSGAPFHVFLGPNASGKTNLLEAVEILSLLKSRRADEEEDLVTWGRQFSRLSAVIETGGGDKLTLEVVSELSPRRRKACFVNDVRVTVADMVGQLPTVAFFPEDLSLFTGPPQERRRFLDQLLCQVSPEYLRSLMEYQKLLKQRNSLLKQVASGGADSASLKPWDEAIATVGGAIVAARMGLAETLNLSLSPECLALGWAQGDDIRLVYKPSVSIPTGVPAADVLREAMTNHRTREIEAQTTLWGPHRDDFDVQVQGRSLPSFASRGQQRLCLVALLFLQVSYLHLRRGEKPIILLDDVFSEFDIDHQGLLLKALTDYQVLATWGWASNAPSTSGPAML
jgi:DNA replication and repair protein RecF